MKAFVERGHVPEPARGATSRPGAARTSTNAYFNDAPIGEIFSTAPEAVTVAPYKGADYFKYHDALQNARHARLRRCRRRSRRLVGHAGSPRSRPF